MVKKYKTVGNLNKVWNHLDNALSEITLATEDLSNMSIDDGRVMELKELLDSFDFSHLVAIKNEIEELINKKGAVLKYENQ